MLPDLFSGLARVNYVLQILGKYSRSAANDHQIYAVGIIQIFWDYGGNSREAGSDNYYIALPKASSGMT
jgi:hypothetical protein